MNPLTNMKNLAKMNENEIRMGNVGSKTSWHNQYRESAWVFFGGMPYELTEGDIICIFSQYGEIVNINLIRDKTTGKSKGFGFVCYEDQRSTDLAVDNFNGAKILNRLIRVDHVNNYKPPKDSDELDDVTKMLRSEGCSATNEALVRLSADVAAAAAAAKPAVEVKQEKTRDGSRERDRNRQRSDRSDRDKGRSGGGGDWDRNKDRPRDRDRDRDRYRDDYRDRSDRDRSRDRDRERDRDRDRDRERERDRSRDRDRDRRRTSSDKDRRDRHR